MIICVYFFPFTVSSSCDFETGLCNWQVTSGAGFGWERVQGVTASGQDYRPSQDHSTDSAQGEKKVENFRSSFVTLNLLHVDDICRLNISKVSNWKCKTLNIYRYIFVFSLKIPSMDNFNNLPLITRWNKATGNKRCNMLVHN